MERRASAMITLGPSASPRALPIFTITKSENVTVQCSANNFVIGCGVKPAGYPPGPIHFEPYLLRQ